MTRISFFYDGNNRINGFELKGHAGFGESGTDIVCAAISALVLNTVNSIESFSKSKFDIEQNKEKGHICFKLPDGADNEAELLLNSLKLGLESVRDNYGKKYIRIEK